MFCLPLPFHTFPFFVGFISAMLLCHQEIRHLGSVWRAPHFFFVLVHFMCVRSVQGKSCYFWCKFVNRLGDAGLIPSLVRIVFFSYFPAICVMLGWKFPSISSISSSWQIVCDVLCLPVSSMYQSCLKFQILTFCGLVLLKLHVLRVTRLKKKIASCGRWWVRHLPIWVGRERGAKTVYSAEKNRDCYFRGIRP